MLKPCVTLLNNSQILNSAPCNSTGAAVALNNELSLEQIKQLSLQVSTDIATRELSQRVDSIQIAIRDDGIIPTGGSAAVFRNQRIDYQASRKLAGACQHPGFNPSTDLTPEQIAELSEGAMFQETGGWRPTIPQPQPLWTSLRRKPFT